MLRFNDFINESDGISDIDRDHLDKQVEYKAHAENILKYITEKYDGEILEKGNKIEVYGTTDNDESTIEFKIPVELRNELSQWLRSQEYLDTIGEAKHEINKIVEIVHSLGLDCAINDFGDTTHFRIDIFNIYFQEKKDLLKSFLTTKKYDL